VKLKIFRILFVTGVISALITIVAAFMWLCGTTEGARWLLASIPRYTSLKLTVMSVEGRLSDRLRLTGVRADTALQKVEIDRLEMRWLPLLLLAGQAGIRELTLDGVRIQDNAPPSKLPPDLTWPHVPETAHLFDVRIARLRVNGFQYRQLNGQPVIITKLSASADWMDSLLSLNNLEIVSPDGRITGKASTGLRSPSLAADLALTLASPLAGMNRISIRGNLLPGRGDEQMAGNLTLSGAAGTQQHMGLSGDIGLTRNGFNLRQVRFVKQGLRGRITGEGKLTLTTQEPLMKLRIKVAGLDLGPDLGLATDMTGELSIEGTTTDYRGSFNLSNKGKGWRTARLAGGYRGNQRGIRLTSLQGAVLDGTVGGDLDIAWVSGVTLRGAIRVRAMNPARIAPDWKGVVNANLSGAAAFPPKASPRWNLNAKLLESKLHGQPLTGELQAAFSDNTLRIEDLKLHGKGFDISGQGTPDKQLNLTARISDLSLLVPGTGGTLQADARVRWRGGRLSGDLNGSGRALQGSGIRIASANLAALLGEGAGYPLHATAVLRSVSTNGMHADSVTLGVDGTLGNHTLNAGIRSSGSEARVGLSGSYGKGEWHGKIASFSGRDAIGPWKLDSPAALAVGGGRLSIAPLAISGVGAERITIAADLIQTPTGGSVQAQWSGLNMARANQWIKGVRLNGVSNGSLKMSLAPQNRLTMTTNAGVQGKLTADGKTFDIRRGMLTLDANERGQRTGVELQLGDGSQLKGTFSSDSPAHLALPDTGTMTAELSGIDLALLKPWLPAGSHFEGKLSGQAAGKLMNGKRLELGGSASLSPTTVQLLAKGGKYNGKVRNASVSWTWQGDSLRGSMGLDLEGRGQVRGTFQLPLPARIPIAITPQGPVRATLNGNFQEQGMLTALFPEMVRESRGDVNATVNIAGSWQAPLMAGELHLARAGAYLPVAGIHVKEVKLDAHLDKDSIRIDSFRTDSGSGHMEGSALIRLKGWSVDSYSGSINGERFQTIHLPELRMTTTPRLTFQGTPDKLTVNGEIRVPELLVQGPPLSNMVEPSKDVIIEGTVPSSTKTTALALDVRIRIIPGDKVFIKMEGIDAQLGGSIDLIMQGTDKIKSSGEIKVVKGRYKAYGVDLEIVRGRVYYAGGSINRPTLDILALRKVGDVQAGVTVTGPIQDPLVKLYSDPSMSDVDALAYVVLGHPLSSTGGDQTALMAQAAGLLLSSNQATSIKDEIQNRLGLSTLGLETQTTSTSRMGYKPIAVAPPGTSSSTKTASTLSQSLVTVGKYLTPQLYLSYGRSVIGNSNLIRLRYTISRKWELETESGTASGADIYYKLEFK